jgi:aryl-alcohol dehydrogenase-like predicted oxidoreductase
MSSRADGSRVASVAWLVYRSTAMLPIPGTSSVGQLEENLQAPSSASATSSSRPSLGLRDPKERRS